MLFENFFVAINQYSVVGTGKVFEDVSDKFSSTFSVFILVLFSLIITVKSYFMNPFTCFASAVTGVSNFDGYVAAYCWVNTWFTFNGF